MPKKQLTVKQAKFVKAVAEGKPKYKAAMEAYDTESMDVANQIAKENLQKTSIQEALQSELARQGITIEHIVAPVAKGLKAKKIVEVEGDFYESDVDDLDKQMKAHDRALKLLGFKDTSEGGGNVHYHLHQSAQKAKYDL